MAERVVAARRDGLTPAAIQAAQTALIDTLGVLLAGSREPGARILASTVGTGAGPATLIGLSGRASAPDAALVNGTSAHALDYDDVSPALVGHPSAVLVPAVLAAAEVTGVAGRTALEGVIVGFEVAARLGRAMNARHYARGWHATGTLGAPAAAAAAAHVFGLDAAQVQVALGIAGSLAAGLRVSFGSMVKPLHAGHAARTGVLAAQLASAGYSAAEALFEAERGFGDLFAGDVDWPAALDDWDWSRPEILRSGIQVKPFPSCAATHTAIDAVLSVREAIDPASVERIECRASRLATQILIHATHDRAAGQVQHAVLRGGGASGWAARPGAVRGCPREAR
jgi:2-methylcitrate dehydratase PrpD